MLFSASASLPKPSAPGRCYIGLDLGQRADHSAIAVLEYAREFNGARNLETYQFLHHSRLRICRLDRLPLGTSYVRVAAHVRELLRRQEFAGRSTLVADATGPGLPFVDFLAAQGLAASLIRVLITSGGKSHWSDGFHHVPRQALIANLALLLQKGALTVDPALREAPRLREELRALKQNGATNAHDDLVMAAALAAWQAIKRCRGAI